MASADDDGEICSKDSSLKQSDTIHEKESDKGLTCVHEDTFHSVEESSPHGGLPDNDKTQDETKGSGYSKKESATKYLFQPRNQTQNHDFAVTEDVRIGNWNGVCGHLLSISKTLNNVSTPAPRDLILQNFDNLVIRHPYFRKTRDQLLSFWSAASFNNPYVYHTYPCQLSPAVRQWVVVEAGKQADIVEVLSVARFLTDDERIVLVREVVLRRHWRLVSLLIARGFASDAMHQWALEEAAQNADQDYFCFFIIPCCTVDTDNDSVMRKLVQRGVYPFTIELLNQKVCSKECSVWAVEEASKSEQAETDLIFMMHKDWISGCHLDSVLAEVSRRGMWNVVGHILQVDCVADSQSRMTAIQEVVTRTRGRTLQKILETCTVEEWDAVLQITMKQGLWTAVRYIFSLVSAIVEPSCLRTVDAFQSRLYTEDSLPSALLQRIDVQTVKFLLTEAIKQELTSLLAYLFMREKHYARKFGVLSTLSPHETAEETCAKMSQKDPDLYASFARVKVVFDEVFTTTRNDIPHKHTKEWQDLLISVQKWTDSALAIHGEIKPQSASGWEALLLQYMSEHFARMSMNFLQYDYLHIVLALVPVIPLVQNVAVKAIAGTDKREFIPHICWFYVREEVRRSVFESAVLLRQWEILDTMVNYTLYDDQRAWAVGHLMDASQWRLAVSLAEFGLTEDLQYYVYQQVAKHADWDVVLTLFERGADVHQIYADLETEHVSRVSQDVTLPRRAARREEKRLQELATLQQEVRRDSEDFFRSVREHKWSAVLSKIRRESAGDKVHLATKAALQARAWHVLVQLVKCGMTRNQRDALVFRILRREQWSVGRALLERGVSPELCLSALPRLLETHQWTLLCRVTESKLDDSCIRKILQYALVHGEGSLAFHCIGSLKSPLTIQERKQVFNQALSTGLWWTVMRLVEEQDSLGHCQRDEAFSAAAERNRWTVVCHCVQQGADVNQKDRHGYTALHKCAQRNEWQQVETLLCLGADPNIVDPDGYSLMHIAMSANSVFITGHAPNTDHYKTLVEFGGDINIPDRRGNIPFCQLIREERADIIQHAIMWGKRVADIADQDGNTALHVVCQRGVTGVIQTLVARGCNPLVKTVKGKTILCAATENSEHASKMVAECIELGVGTFQPPVTDKNYKKKTKFPERTPLGVQEWETFSPFQRAAVLGDMELMDMLYQAGACSYAELRRFSKALKKRSISLRSRVWKKAKELSEYVECLAKTPRSLKSSCRLVISHHLGVEWKRERRVKQLDSLCGCMKDYTIFSDILKKKRLVNV